MSKETVYHWYVYPRDADTNQAISRVCEEYEDLLRDVMCADGKRRWMWRCTHEIRNALLRSAEQLTMHFDIFSSQEVPNVMGNIRQVNFLFKKPRKKYVPPKGKPACAGTQKATK